MSTTPIFMYPTLITDIEIDGDANLLDLTMRNVETEGRTQHINFEDETVAIHYGDEATHYHSLKSIIQEWMKAKQAKLI